MRFKESIQRARWSLYGIKPTIEQFHKLLELEARRKPEDGLAKKIYDEAEFAAILTGKTAEEGLKYTSSDILRINKQYKKPKDFSEVSSVVRRFTIGNRVFKMIPEFKNFTQGQHISLNEWTKSDKVIHENLHNLAALCTVEYRFPYIRKRKETKQQFFERAEFMRKNCPAEIAHQLAGFFLQTQTEFLRIILKSQRRQLTQISSKTISNTGRKKQSKEKPNQ